MKNIFHNNIAKTLLAGIFFLSAQFIAAQPGYFGPFFIHTATAANQAGNWTVMNNGDLNGNSGAQFIYTANWNVASIYNNFNTGVWYTGTNWAVYNENTSDTIPVGSGFNVLVPTVQGALFTHTSNSANVDQNWTTIDNAATNNNPNAIIFVAHNWGAVGGVYNDHATGVWYTGTNWAIYNEDLTPFPEGAAYTVFVPNAPLSNVFVHTAVPSNTANHYTLIDNALTNNNPNAVIFVTHNWNPNGAGGVYNTAPLGVWYTSGKWSIFNQNTSIPIDSSTSFNVLVADTLASGTGVNEISSANIRLSVSPNPSASAIGINYEIKEGGKVSLKLYSVTGQQIAVLYEGNQSAGIYTLNESVAALEAGSYFYVLNVNGYMTRKPLMVVK